MDLHNPSWQKTISWGVITGLFYALLFSFSSELLHLAHTTPDACVIVHGDHVTYFHRLDPAVCAAQGGPYTEGHWTRALVPILIAFAMSYAHGAFTGRFWDSMGLKAVSSKH